MLHRVRRLVVDPLIPQHINQLSDDCVVRWAKASIVCEWFFGVFDFENAASDSSNENGYELEKVKLMLSLLQGYSICRWSVRTAYKRQDTPVACPGSSASIATPSMSDAKLSTTA